MSRDVPHRRDIAPEHTWHLENVFSSDDAWEEGFKQVVEAAPRLESFRGRLHEGPAVLVEWFAVQEDVFRILGRVFIYASMVHNVDTAEQEGKAKNERAMGLLARTVAAAAFAEPEMIAIGFETLRAWIAREPRLAIYGHSLDVLERRQEHVRSPEIEELLGLVRDPFDTASSTHSVLGDTDLRFKPAKTSTGDDIEVVQGNVGALLTDSDREVRRTVWESYNEAHLALKNTMANCLSAGVKQNVFMARARAYRSSLEAALEANNIPVDVFHSLINTYRRNLPIWHRYWRVRKKALGYNALHVYDIKAPLTPDPPRVPYETAINWIVEGMRPLGDEYVEILRRGALEQRWVDRYPNQHKTSGAYSSGWPGTHPFILTSYTDDIFSMSVLAHELGHSLHSYYAWSNQPLVYCRYGLFVAEVASNFNQAMVRSYLVDAEQDTDFQIALIEEAMSNFHRYFFIMPTLARFEVEIHERVERGQGLTADVLVSLMSDLFAEGYGEEVNIDRERIGITWAEFSGHMYANFYVYQYATGISAAHALAQGVLEGGPERAGMYIDFLKAGGSMYPLDALKLAGVDMTTPEPVEKTFGVLSQLVDRLEELVERRRPDESKQAERATT
jgi:oligoendopeptidase F